MGRIALSGVTGSAEGGRGPSSRDDVRRLYISSDHPMIFPPHAPSAQAACRGVQAHGEFSGQAACRERGSCWSPPTAIGVCRVMVVCGCRETGAQAGGDPAIVDSGRSCLRTATPAVHAEILRKMSESPKVHTRQEQCR